MNKILVGTVLAGGILVSSVLVSYVIAYKITKSYVDFENDMNNIIERHTKSVENYIKIKDLFNEE